MATEDFRSDDRNKIRVYEGTIMRVKRISSGRIIVKIDGISSCITIRQHNFRNLKQLVKIEFYHSDNT